MAASRFGISSRTSAKHSTLSQQFRSGSTVDGSIHSASAEQGTVSGVHNRVNP